MAFCSHRESRSVASRAQCLLHLHDARSGCPPLPPPPHEDVRYTHSMHVERFRDLRSSVWMRRVAVSVCVGRRHVAAPILVCRL